MRRTTSGILILILLVGVFGTGYWLGQRGVGLDGENAGISTSNDERIQLASFNRTWELIHERYYQQPIDDAALVKGAIDGMLATLDDQHTRYLDPDTARASTERLEGEFEGIGAYIDQNEDGNIVVVSPIVGSPAAAAGLQPGDIFIKADDTDLRGLDPAIGASYVRGPAGSIVHLTIERDGTQLEFDIERAAVEIMSALGEMLDDNIGYIQLTQFGFNTNDQLEAVLSDLENQGATSIVLDLRRNPGGSLDGVVDIADQFLTDGVILVERFGTGSDKIFRSDDDNIYAETVPLVVLVDEGSASASEVLAGAIQDRERGIVIGETSFGKGTVQSGIDLANGGSVRITIARWLTPDETWVHETGLEPDLFIDLDTDFAPTRAEDIQLQAAIDYLLGRPVVESEQPAEN